MSYSTRDMGKHEDIVGPDANLGVQHDLSLTYGGPYRKAYEGALVLFNVFGLNRRPFDDEHHRRAYMAMSSMQHLMERVPLTSMSPRMSNEELFAAATHDFAEAIDAYRSRGR